MRCLLALGLSTDTGLSEATGLSIATGLLAEIFHTSIISLAMGVLSGNMVGNSPLLNLVRISAYTNE